MGLSLLTYLAFLCILQIRHVLDFMSFESLNCSRIRPGALVCMQFYEMT